MIEIENSEMKKISGGGISIGAVIGIGSFITFLIGVIDGYKPQCLHKRV